MSDIDVKKALQQHLQSLQWSGVTGLPSGGELEFDLASTIAAPTAETKTPSTPKATTATESSLPLSASTSPAKPSAKPSAKSPVPSPASPATAPAVPQQSPQDSLNASRQTTYGQPIAELGQREDALATLAAEVAGCQKCPELCRNRTNTVFGTGPADAKIVFLGEGPGTSEDAQGEPFVGAAGQLLNKILTASKLHRDQVYILNVVKCHPPADRTPTSNEVQNCGDYLQRQLDIIQPTHIVCLGSVAAKALLNTKSSLGKLRKQFHSYCGSKVIATYHPAYLLQTPDAKKFVWEDMKMLMNDLGVDLS